MRVNIEYEPTFAESEWTTDFTGKKGIYGYESNITRAYTVVALPWG
jgi:hypothetical protein